jgi:hypothetical protein
MRRKDVKSGWYVCFRTADGREVRRAAGKSRRSAERIKAKIGALAPGDVPSGPPRLGRRSPHRADHRGDPGPLRHQADRPGQDRFNRQREIAVLRHALRQAARWKTETKLSQYRLAEWMPLREAETMRKPVFLTRDEVDRVLRVANLGSQRRGLNGRQGEAVIRLALETGARLRRSSR